jgi:hypothetical protein
MRRVIHGYARDKNGTLAFIGNIPIPSARTNALPSLAEKRDPAGATIFKKEAILMAAYR